MTVKTRRWDVADHLNNDAEIIAYLDACFDEDPGDGSLIRAALGDIARAKGMTDMARETGIKRESLYRALSPDGNPEFVTILKTLKALGLKLHAQSI
jgi:probable addiction module antidote protein